jgi:murein L,D-transpeptidase YcbB/YkuD
MIIENEPIPVLKQMDPVRHNVAMNNTTILFLFLLSFSFLSCKHYKTEKAQKRISTDQGAEDFADKLQTMLQTIDTTKAGKHLSDPGYNLRYTYQQNEYMPVWLSQGKPVKATAAYLQELEEIRWDGLDPEKYKLSTLKKLHSELLAGKTGINDLINFDTLFTRSYLMASHDLLLGEINPRKADSTWFYKNDTVWAAPAILLNNDEQYTSLDSFRSSLPTYALLQNAYKYYYELAGDSNLNKSLKTLKDIKKPGTADISEITKIIQQELPWMNKNDSVVNNTQLLSAYQYYMGLKPTGIPDSITLAHLSQPLSDITNRLRANMERLRWMQKQFADTYILVNIPLMELFFRKDDCLAMHMRVVVGQPARQTPSLNAFMTSIVINPRWSVPPTILKKDVLPGITKGGSKYLAKKGLIAYNKDGDIIDPSKITPRNYKNYYYRQSPGDDNALGYVKFNLPNPYDIYLHDTPYCNDFTLRSRALSSGCVRVQQPKEMAIYILSQLEGKRFNEDVLDSMIQEHKTKWEMLKNKIPVSIVYLTAFEDSTGAHPRLLNDVYKRDSSLISLLK